MIKKYTYGYIICSVIGVLLITTTSNNTIAAQDQKNNTTAISAIAKQNQTNTTAISAIAKQNQTNTTAIAGLTQLSPVPFKEIPLVIINSVYHEDKFGADFSIDYSHGTVIEQDFSASSVPNMRLNKDDTTLSLQLLCDSSDICDASLVPEKVKIYLADDEIQDIQIAENSFPTLELGSKTCYNLSIEDCANFSFSIPENTILGNYKLVVEISFEEFIEAKWIFINPVEIIKSTYKVDTISGLGDGPIGIAYDPLHQRMYVANQAGSTVSVIDTITNKVIGNPISVGQAPTFLAYDPVHHRMYVINQADSTISVIDTITNTVIDTDPNTPGINPITVVGGANAIAYDPVHKRMYVTVSNSTIYVIDTNTMAVIDTIVIQAQLSGIEYDPIHQWMYVSNYVNANAVIVIDTNTNAVIGNPIPVGEGPTAIAFDPVNQRIYVAHERDDRVYVINTNTNTVVDKIFVGSTTTNIAYDPINQRMYPTHNMDNVVSVIDTTRNTVIDIISVGRDPMDIAYDPVNHRMYVTNSSDDNISIIYL